MKGLLPRPLHPALQILLVLVLALVGLSLASFAALVIAKSGFGLSLAQFSALTAHPAGYPQAWPVLMLLQGLSLAGVGLGAVVLPLLLRQPVGEYFAPRRLGAAWWPLAAGLLIIISLPALSAVVAWNANAHFPAALHGFELWARGKEDEASELIKFLTQFTSLGRLLIGLVVIGVVPGVAEELVFRGVIQRNLVRWSGSRHVGVWLAAALFSAIHFQFFGFVPRFLLGLLLGYLYEWSGNILVPMAAHFTNNAFQLLLLYLAQGRHLPASFDPDANQVLPWPSVLLSAGLSLALLYVLHQRLAPAPPPVGALADIAPISR